MASNSTYTDQQGRMIIFHDVADKSVFSIEIDGKHCRMPKRLIRQLVCEHDYQVVDRSHVLQSNPQRYPTLCSKCGSTSSIRCTEADSLKITACTHALDGVIYTTCPRIIHASRGEPCENCIDPLGGRRVVDKLTPRPACKTCGTYLDCHGDECTFDYSGGA